MIRLRTLVAAFAAVAAIGAGAAWAAGGGSTTPSTTNPGTTTPGATHPRAKHNCPNMGDQRSSNTNGAAYAPAGSMNL
jgi:hypothetical protein